MQAAPTKDVFERMRHNYALVRELDLPNIKSEYWDALLTRGRQEHGGKGDFIDREDLWTDFRNNVISKGLDGANVPEAALERIYAKWRSLYERVGARIPERYRPLLDESPIGNPRTLEIDGLAITQSSLEYTLMLTHLEPYLRDVVIVLDIGGGYGGMARHIKLAYPDRCIVLLDLPEVNAIQTYFLTRSFPDARILGLEDLLESDPIDPRRLDADFLILPGQLIAKLARESFDLVINTRSMMEMDLATVSMYLSHIQEKLHPGGVFFCINRYVKKTRLKDYPFDDKWYVSYSEPWPRFIDENPHHELIAVRTAHPVRYGLREQAARFPPFDGLVSRLRAKLLGALERR